MTLAIILATLATLASAPDLCAEVYLDADGTPYTDALDQTFPRYCEPSGPDAPDLDAELCCVLDEAGDDAQCDFPDFSGRCDTGERYYCEYGEATADGATCYQPFLDACDMGLCLDDGGLDDGEIPPVEATESLLCCTSQGCEPISSDVAWLCKDIEGYVVFCNEAVSNEDGTVTCFELE